MASEMKKDKVGGEVKMDEGVEHHAIWLPMTIEEKEAVMKKGDAEKINVAKLTANFLREWASSKELTDAALSKVAGGAMRPTAGVKYSTVMCPW